MNDCSVRDQLTRSTHTHTHELPSRVLKQILQMWCQKNPQKEVTQKEKKNQTMGIFCTIVLNIYVCNVMQNINFI